jgi:hypothetical protein
MKRYKPKKPREVVLFIDDALDDEKTTKEDFKKYQESIWDVSHLKFKEGQKPALWKVQALTRRQKDYAETFEDGRERWGFIVRCGLLGHKNYVFEDEDGGEYPAPQPEREEQGRLGIIATEKWLDEIDLSTLELQGLAIIINYLSDARAPLAKR